MTPKERSGEVATPEFSLELYQQTYLSTSDTVMDSILRVTASELSGVSTPVAAEVILLDCSGSMAVPKTKIAAARIAGMAAIDALRDGTQFAVVQGTSHADMCYPTTQRMAVADQRTRAEAKEHISALAASGGTAMGTWLRLAHELFTTTFTPIRHAVLLTDGRNESESSEQLERVLAECDGQFCCDARGIGTDWDPHELRRIVGVLRGACDAVRVEADLVDDFRALARAAMAKVVPDLRIRVTTARDVELRGLKQAYPREADYTGNPARHDGPVWEFSTGSWAGHDSRDFQLSLHVTRDDRDPIGEDLHAALVELISEGSDDAIATESVLVHWTTDPVLSSRFDAEVAHYQGQAELTKLMLAGFDSFDAGRLEDAVRDWGRAVRLASKSANTEALTRLTRLVDVVDAEQGIVRLKPNVSRTDLLSSAAGADLSIRSGDSGKQQPVSRAAARLVTAPCGHQVTDIATFCGECGRAVNGPSQ